MYISNALKTITFLTFIGINLYGQQERPGGVLSIKAIFPYYPNHHTD